MSTLELLYLIRVGGLLQKPFLNTRTSHSKRDISRSRFMVDLVSTTVVVILAAEIMNMAVA